MNKSNKFSPEVRERAVRMVQEHRTDYLWIFKRLIDGKDIAAELMPLVYAQRHRGNTDEVSLRAIEARWERHFSNMPPLEDMPPEQLDAVREIMDKEEARRQQALQGLLASP
jgi:hypothetical protein